LDPQRLSQYQSGKDVEVARQFFHHPGDSSKTSMRRHYAIISYRATTAARWIFSKDGLEEAGKAIDRIYETVDRVGRAVKSSPRPRAH
jgi:hypothetical protein